MNATTAPGGSTPRYLLLVLLIALATLGLVGLFDSAQYFIFQEIEGKPIPWAKLTRNYLPYWGMCALLMPLVAWLALRLGFPAGQRVRIVLIHVATAIVFVHVHIGATQLAFFAMVGKQPSFSDFVGSTAARMTRVVELDLMIYTIAVVAVLLVEANRRFREKERASARLAVETANLQASLSAARLDALRMQLQPHFLFNALHAISTLIMRGDNQAAHRMLLALSDFLRMTLDSSDTQEVALDVELEFLDAYLQIQRERFGDRLQVTTEIAPAASGALVPALVLQPLVENAIRHGVGKVEGLGLITILATTDDDELVVEVQDNGPGVPPDSPGDGVGLANIRARLEQLYPGRHTFGLEPGRNGGAVATLRLPLRIADIPTDTGVSQ